MWEPSVPDEGGRLGEELDLGCPILAVTAERSGEQPRGDGAGGPDQGVLIRGGLGPAEVRGRDDPRDRGREGDDETSEAHGAV